MDSLTAFSAVLVVHIFHEQWRKPGMNGQAPSWLCRPADTHPPTMALLCFDSHWVESKFFLRVQAARVVLGEWVSCVLSNNNVQELKNADSGFQGLSTELRSSQASFGTMCWWKQAYTLSFPHFPLQSCQSSSNKKKELGICRLTNCTRKILERVWGMRPRSPSWFAWEKTNTKSYGELGF